MKIEQNSGYYFVELYVGMAKMVAWWHEQVLGFEIAGKREKKGLHGMEVSFRNQNETFMAWRFRFGCETAKPI